MLYLNFSKAYGYQNWQDGVFSWEAVIYKMTWLFDHMVIWGHVTNKKRYISTSIKPVATRLYWKAYGKYLPTTKLHVLSITGSREAIWHEKTLYFHISGAYAYQTWQDDDLWEGVTTNNSQVTH